MPSLSSSVFVHITLSDVNDILPLFERDVFYVSVREDTETDTVLLSSKITDKEQGEFGDVTFTIEDSGSSLCSVEQNGTGFRLLNKIKFDRELSASHQFYIRATNLQGLINPLCEFFRCFFSESLLKHHSLISFSERFCIRWISCIIYIVYLKANHA